jgi:Zn-dependent protease with chaperone function
VNFFEHQYRARRRTGLLVAYFTVAVVLIVLAVNVAVYFVLHLAAAEAAPDPGQWLARPYWRWIAAGVIAIVALGSLLSWLKLRGGGRAVAEMVGARRIDMASRDPDERRLINVVEEMSIASGTPVPALYVMDEEQGINAFVAGYRVNEAVLVVTRGAMRQLSRDELQGVIGHEYSHVLNGDMRLNVRLISVLAGVLLIGQIGGFVLRSMRHAGRRGGKDGGAGLILALGLALFVIGYVGLLFGRIIKAAVSRQREFLADASSVQFTRNPDGIAGALWKIKQHVEGSRLLSSHAEDMSHMCFGESIAFRFGGLMSTHPPLEVRIKRVSPHFMARLAAERNRRQADAAIVAPPAAAGAPPGAAAVAMGFAGGEAPVRTTPETIIESVGRPTERHVGYAGQLHAALPEALLDAVHHAESARHAAYALVLAATDPAGAPAARALIETREGAAAAQAAAQLSTQMRALGPKVRLPLLDIAIPTLKQLDAPARTVFLATIEELIRADRRFTLFEFVLLTLLTEHLDDDAQRADAIRHFKFEAVMHEIRVLMTVMVRTGTAGEAEAAAAFQRVMQSFSRQPLGPVPLEECSPARLTLALRKLALMSPLLKRSLLNACADCVLHDGRVAPAEGELLRAIALSLDCPMPPLLPA